MDFRKLTLTGLVMASMLGASMVAVGCGDDDVTPTDGGHVGTDGGGTDGGMTGMCDPTGTTDFFVMSIINIGAADPAGSADIVPGVNLDGVVSTADDVTSCGHPDFTSPPPDNEPGVDNQLGPILDTLGGSLDVAGNIADAIASGSLLLLVEVEHIDDRTNDPCVTLNMYLGELPVGVAMPEVDAMNRVTPGQTFDINPASFMAGEPLISVNGPIVNGRLRAGPVDVTLNLPISGSTLALELRNAQIRFNIDGSSLSNGILGGQLDVAQTITAVAGLIDGFSEMAIASLLEPQADLDYDPATMTCNAVSLGLVFDAVGATRGVVAMPPPPPADGGTPDTDGGTPDADGGTPDADGGV